jgi:hypothetical protein
MYPPPAFAREAISTSNNSTEESMLEYANYCPSALLDTLLKSFSKSELMTLQLALLL